MSVLLWIIWKARCRIPCRLRRWLRRRYIGRPAREGLVGDREHLDLLRQGAATWNEWRRRQRELGEAGERPNLKGFNLRGKVLSDYDLRDADIQEAVLRGATVRGNLRGALLLRADLRGANLRGAWLDDRESDLRAADLRGCDLSEALLDQADLRLARGLILDSSRIRDTRFSPTARDPWSILRRNYTGPRFVFNLAFLTLFLVPYGAKTMTWVTANRLEQRVDETLSWVEAEAKKMKVDEPVRAFIVRMAFDYARERAPSKANGWREYRVWELLVGIDREALYWAGAIVLLVYNIVRGFLTVLMAPLRDEEERSGHTAAFRARSYWRFREAYGWMIFPHYVVKALLGIAVVAFIVHLIAWLSLPVLLPPR
jgi:hypothetical protein